MGVLPLQFPAGETAESLGLDGEETFDDHRRHRAERRVDPAHGARSRRPRSPASTVEFDAVVRIDTPGEADYYRNGGILQYVLRSLVTS